MLESKMFQNCIDNLIHENFLLCTIFITWKNFFFFQYAQETQHEKILRGLAVGIAFTMYGRLEEADPLVASLCADKDPILRRSGMYTLAMAYCGTGNNQAIRKLLHVAVSFTQHSSKIYSFVCWTFFPFQFYFYHFHVFLFFFFF